MVGMTVEQWEAFFQKSANQAKEKALTIFNSISRNCLG